MTNLALNFSARIQDGLGVQTRAYSYLQLPDTATAAQLQAAAGTWARDIDACIDGAIEQVAITINVPLPAGLKAATGATFTSSLASKTGVVGLDVTPSGRRYGQGLPTLAATLVSGGTVDVNAAQIVALATLLQTPLLGGYYSSEGGQQLAQLLGAFLGNRKHPEQLAALTRTN